MQSSAQKGDILLLDDSSVKSIATGGSAASGWTLLSSEFGTNDAVIYVDAGSSKLFDDDDSSTYGESELTSSSEFFVGTYTSTPAVYARKESFADLATAQAGDGLLASSGVFSVKVDDASIEIDSDVLGVKALGIDTAELAADAVTGAKVADDAIDSEHIAAGAIDLAHMSANSIDSDQYVDGSIDTAHIADSQITLAKMAANSVDSDQYVDGSIDTAHIADSQITLAKMAANSVDSDQYVDGSVDNVHLANSAISVTDGNNSSDISLGGTLTFSGTSNEVELAESSGTVTIGLPSDVTIGQDLTVTRNAVITGNLTVNGTATTVDTTNMNVEDPLIQLGMNNSANSVDLGFVGKFNDGDAKYSGLVRDADASGKFRLFETEEDLSAATTVDISDASYSKSTLVADLEGNADTATALETAREFSMTGDVAASAVSFDATGNVTLSAAIQNGAVDLAHMSANSVDSDQYVDGSIDTIHIADSQITLAKMAANSVDSDQYVDGSIDTAHIADSQITLAKMAANSVDSDQYVDGSIDTAHIADLQVTTDKLAADAVTGAKLADDAVDSEHITDGAIDLAHMSANSVDSDQYVDGSIDTAHIADSQITLAKMAANSVDSDQYVDGSIDTAHIADSQITLAKMAANSVDSDQYVDGSLDLDHFAPAQQGGSNLPSGMQFTWTGSEWQYARPAVMTQIDVTFDSNGNADLDASEPAWVAQPTTDGEIRIELSHSQLFGSQATSAPRFMAQVFVETSSGTQELAGTNMRIVVDGSNLYAFFDLDGAVAPTNSTSYKVFVAFVQMGGLVNS